MIHGHIREGGLCWELRVAIKGGGDHYTTVYIQGICATDDKSSGREEEKFFY